MTDIVERLRKPLDGMPAGFYRECGELRREAADEIERLRAELIWVSEQRWNEDADLDDICTRTDQVLTGRLDGKC